MPPIISLFVLFLSTLSPASPSPDASLRFVRSCHADMDCEMALFRELSTLYRPSREEHVAIDYVQRLKAVAETEIWKHALDSSKDQLGNLVIRVPATGKFLGRNEPYLAVQAHLDMVLAHKHAKPGEDLRKYFGNGVELETTGDWMHSKGRLSTIGADNGFGVAMALRYLLDPTLPHPSLELVFTVREEVGLAGALGMEAELKSRRLISLDGMAPEPRAVLVASQGSYRTIANGKMLAESEQAGGARVRITLGNLAGGHSGGDIHLQRLNGVRGVAHLLSHLQRRFSGMQVISVVAGDGGSLNKIPNAFEAEISLPEDQVNPSTLQSIELGLREMVAQHRDDNLGGFTVKVERLEPAARGLALSFASAIALVRSVLGIPNGVLEHDPEFPNQIATSSNLGALKISANGQGQFDVLVGAMPRSFLPQSLQSVVREIEGKVRSAFSGSERVEFKDGGSYPPWKAPLDSPLRARALSLKKYFEKAMPTTVGIEPSAFALKYPGMDIIAFSPLIRNAHTINEELSLSSARESVEALRALLAAEN